MYIVASCVFLFFFFSCSFFHLLFRPVTSVQAFIFFILSFLSLFRFICETQLLMSIHKWDDILPMTRLKRWSRIGNLHLSALVCDTGGITVLGGLWLCFFFFFFSRQLSAYYSLVSRSLLAIYYSRVAFVSTYQNMARIELPVAGEPRQRATSAKLCPQKRRTSNCRTGSFCF